MAVPRMHLVDETCSSLYHCVSRTVRQAFLLAPEAEGVVDNRRRDWLLERIRFQSQVFAIDCVSLALMSNHLHLLLRTLPELVESWSAVEVAYRWLLLRPPRLLRGKLGLDPNGPPQEEELEMLAGNAGRIAVLRGRLSSLSWYMKELKEQLARRVNREEGRTGAFWEERFRSFRVLDDPGILRCATYIDLNPVAAGVVDDPVLARYTSVEEFARMGAGTRTESETSATPGAPGGPGASGASVSRGMHGTAADAGGADRRLAARALWRAVLKEPSRDGGLDSGSDLDADPAFDPPGGAGLARKLDDFIASFDDVRFQPAVPARREPHHPRGTAADDEPIEAVPVLGIQKGSPTQGEGRPDEGASEDGAAEEGAGSLVHAAAGSEAPPSARGLSDEGRMGSGEIETGKIDAAGESGATPVEQASGGGSPAVARSAPQATRARESRLDGLPLPPPRQARHRRRPPAEQVHEISLGEYLRRLRRLTALAQERGLGRRGDRTRRRSVVEIEMALGREADDQGVASLFAEMFGTDLGGASEEIAALLSGLMGGARHYGTAIGSRAALAAEALRRGRSRVVSALRTNPPRRRGRGKHDEGGLRSGDCPGAADAAPQHPARGDPTGPGAG